MATIQRSNTKVANKLINYAEKRATVREGVNCPPEYAKSQMKSTRELWGKPDGIQAHHVIQSFKPGEVTPEMANQIGQDLAREIAKGHEAVVYTHTDKDHVHNHIVINSVSFEDGKKYHASKESLYQIREANDRLCKERGISVVQEKNSPIRYTLAEKGLLESGKTSWKEEIRKVIDHERQHSTSYVEFKDKLQQEYGIEVKERGKNITFTHPDNGRKVRGATLGNDYEKETISNGFEREVRNQERGTSRVQNEERIDRGSQRDQSRTPREVESNRELSVSTPERRNDERDRNYGGTKTNQRSQQTSTKADDFNIHEFNKRFEERKRRLQGGYTHQYYRADEIDKDAKQLDDKQQRESKKGTDKEQGLDRAEIEANRDKQQKQLERNA